LKKTRCFNKTLWKTSISTKKNTVFDFLHKTEKKVKINVALADEKAATKTQKARPFQTTLSNKR